MYRLHRIHSISFDIYLHSGWRHPLYFLHVGGSDTSILLSTMVISWDSLCPPFTSAPNCNIFQSHFGVNFFVDGKQYVRHLSPFGYTSCYLFQDNFRYCLSHRDNWYVPDARIPAKTSLWILDSLHDRICQILDSNFKISKPINLQ